MSDVARMAKVGKITVSRVLNDSPHVTDATRKRVFAAIKKLGYVPDESARTLRLQKSRCIGLILPSLLDHFFAICAHAVHECAQKHGYMVMTVCSNGDPETEAAQIQAMLRRRIDGIVIVPASSRKCILAAPEFCDAPAVAFDRPVPGGKQDYVVVENQRGAKLAVEHLIKHGHRRIAYLGPSGDFSTIRERLHGFRIAAKERGAETTETSCIDDLPQTIAALRTMLDGPAAPTAAFMPNNVTTKLVVEALQTLGVDVPSSLALVGFDSFELDHVVQPPLTVIAQPFEEMARQAAELLFERLENESTVIPQRKMKLPVALIVRESCGCTQQAKQTVAVGR